MDVPAMFHKIITEEPTLLRPENLRQRNAFQMRIIAAIARADASPAELADLAGNIGTLYAGLVPHAERA
jgi:hypothetical protein